MAELVMPRLSDTMEEGTILRWLKADGDQIRRGDELVEIETDKANMIYESDLSGTLHTVAAEGDTLPVGQLIAHVGDADANSAEPAAGAPDAEDTSTAARDSAQESFVESIAEVAGGGAASDVPPGDGARVKASPLARRIARDRGVDLHALSGSGPGGRIVKADVEAAGAGATAPDEGPRRQSQRDTAAAVGGPAAGATPRART